MTEAPVAPAPLEPLPEDWQRALAVVAHPDDMEYGSAAAVARWTRQGKQIAYCLLTNGEAGLLRRQPVDAGLAVGEQAVGDLLALPGPAGDSGGRAVLHVVRMSHHCKRTLPVLGQRLEWGGGYRRFGHAIPFDAELIGLRPRSTGRQQPARPRSGGLPWFAAAHADRSGAGPPPARGTPGPTSPRRPAAPRSSGSACRAGVRPRRTGAALRPAGAGWPPAARSVARSGPAGELAEAAEAARGPAGSTSPTAALSRRAA